MVVVCCLARFLIIVLAQAKKGAKTLERVTESSVSRFFELQTVVGLDRFLEQKGRYGNEKYHTTGTFCAFSPVLFQSFNGIQH